MSSTIALSGMWPCTECCRCRDEWGSVHEELTGCEGDRWGNRQLHDSQINMLPEEHRTLFFLFPFPQLYSNIKAPHSGTLAWKIPWMEEPGRLQSMGSLRVEHDWATSLSLFTFMHWRRKWQPTPVFLPGEPQGWGSLVGCRLWGHTESDTTEVT